MPVTINRRNWLQTSATLTAGAFLPTMVWSGPYRGHTPTGEIVLEHDMTHAAAGNNELKIRLNANENPYGPSDKAKAALQKSIDMGFRYAFDEAQELKKIIADYYGLTVDHVLLGGGSSEILTMAGMAYGLQDGSVVSAHPTFRTLFTVAERFGCEWIQVPLDSDLKHDLPAMKAAIQPNTKLMYVCNPNNPTGTLMDPGAVNAFCKDVSAQMPVFVDEAYTEFLEDPEGNSTISLIREGHDVIVAKTFSKIYGMAGLRVGFALAPPERIKELAKFGISLSTVSRTSMAAAKACFGDEEFMAMCKKKNKEAREYTQKGIHDLGYTGVVPSYTSFMIFPIEMKGSDFLKKMRDQSVGVRSWYFNDTNWCRVSVGTMADMEGFLSALKRVS